MDVHSDRMGDRCSEEKCSLILLLCSKVSTWTWRTGVFFIACSVHGCKFTGAGTPALRLERNINTFFASFRYSTRVMNVRWVSTKASFPTAGQTASTETWSIYLGIPSFFFHFRFNGKYYTLELEMKLTLIRTGTYHYEILFPISRSLWHMYYQLRLTDLECRKRTFHIAGWNKLFVEKRLTWHLRRFSCWQK